MNEFVTLVVNNVLEIVIAGIFLVLTTFVVPWSKRVVSPFLKNTVIPWLEEKRLYSIVKKFVEAAEKKAESEEIDKHQWVVFCLESKGITITDEINAYIESACKEIDMIEDSIVDTLTGKDEIK